MVPMTQLSCVYSNLIARNWQRKPNAIFYDNVVSYFISSCRNNHPTSLLVQIWSLSLFCSQISHSWPLYKNKLKFVHSQIRISRLVPYQLSEPCGLCEMSTHMRFFILISLMSKKGLNWGYTSVQIHQSVQCSYTQRMGVDKGTGQI